MSLVNTTSVQCTLYPTAATTFTSLISQACPFDTIRDCEGPSTLMLIYDPNATPKYSSFKMALFGHSGCPVISDSTSVCIKQCWYLCKASGAHLLYDNPTQIVKLSAKINCLCWASALMGIVYDFVDKHIQTHGQPSSFTMMSLPIRYSPMAFYFWLSIVFHTPQVLRHLPHRCDLLWPLCDCHWLYPIPIAPSVRYHVRDLSYDLWTTSLHFPFLVFSLLPDTFFRGMAVLVAVPGFLRFRVGFHVHTDIA